MFIAPAVVGDSVLIGSCSGKLDALDVETGKLRWRYDTATDGPPASFHGDLLVADQRVIVGTDIDGPAEGLIYAFDLASGALQWQAGLGDVASDLLAYDNLVLGATVEGRAFALDQATGRTVWQYQTETGKEALNGDPVLAGGRFFFRDSATVYALDPAAGALLWQSTVGGTLNTSLVAFAGQIGVGTLDGTILLLDATNGEIRSERRWAEFVYGNLTSAGDCLLALGRVGQQHRLACLTGDPLSERWQLTSELEWTAYQPWVGDGMALLGNQRGRVLAVSLEDGKELWSTRVEGIARGLSWAAGTLYVGTFQGRVYALPNLGNTEPETAPMRR